MHCELQSLNYIQSLSRGQFKHAAAHGIVLRKKSKLHPLFALKNKIMLCFQYQHFKLQWASLTFV